RPPRRWPAPRADAAPARRSWAAARGGAPAGAPPRPAPTPVTPPSPAPRPPAAVVAADGRPPVEPEGLPSGADVAPDSEVDGATLGGSLVARAASVRGDRARLDGVGRTDGYLLRVLGDHHTRPALVSVVASGRPGPATQALTRTACQALVAQLSRLGVSIDTSWRSGDLRAVRGVLEGVLPAVHGRVAELARVRNLSGPAAEVGLTCVVSDLGDRSTRRHLAFRVGRGNAFLRDGDEWVPVLPENPDADVEVATVTTRRGDLLALTTGSGARAFGRTDVGPVFAEQWRSAPSDLVDFLRQLGVRTTATDDDRTVVCLWDFTPPTDHAATE
ncbi:hypothetical protein AB0G50_35455, partial [Actinosynnema sp. NPDC020468]